MEIIFDILRLTFLILGSMWLASLATSKFQQIRNNKTIEANREMWDGLGWARGYKAGFKSGRSEGYAAGSRSQFQYQQAHQQPPFTGRGMPPNPASWLPQQTFSDDQLLDLLKLIHPDRHPPERRELATRVTQQVNALRSKR